MAEILAIGPVVPVVVIRDAAQAVPLARALLAGGVHVVEVTLRSNAALDSIKQIRAAVPEVTVGAGSVLTPVQLDAVKAVGAAFAVSPGATPALLDAAEQAKLPYLPGAATVSEVMALLARGYRCQKFFPAESSGGIGFLHALAGPLPELRFCPTGGINAGNAAAYLALSNVPCVGGSWLAPEAAVGAGNWDAITDLARGATALRAAV
jgi:2-dehydro-3-deoxyphosphogluconate aldolase/(4S)-4-hydroxy-2-oxoglutarate aldolase